jgi:hypothetical protein
MQTRQKRNLGVADAEDRVFALDGRDVLRGHTDLTGKALLAELELAPGGTKMPADMTGYRTGSIGMYPAVSEKPDTPDTAAPLVFKTVSFWLCKAEKRLLAPQLAPVLAR